MGMSEEARINISRSTRLSVFFGEMVDTVVQPREEVGIKELTTE